MKLLTLALGGAALYLLSRRKAPPTAALPAGAAEEVFAALMQIDPGSYPMGLEAQIISVYQGVSPPDWAEGLELVRAREPIQYYDLDLDSYR